MSRAAFPGGGSLLRSWRGPAASLVEVSVGQGPLWWLRGSRMRTKAGLMDEWAAAAQFPPHFGGTWDALRDALADLPEGGTFLVLEADQLLQEAPPQDRAAWLAVMQSVAEDLSPHPFGLVLQAEGAQYEALAAQWGGLGPA